MRTTEMDETKRGEGEYTRAYLGDIYHSEMVVVDKPNAESAFVGANQEAYWRSINGYKAWAEGIVRDSVIYVGANDGMLHAFSVKDGIELWGFIPPFIGARLPEMVNANLNRTTTPMGGSNAIYGVDGSPVVHDMYFIKPGTNGKAWYTILMIPYGRGGEGFSVLDVTDPKSPEHLYSIYNDYILKKVHFVDHKGEFDEWDYIATHYGLASFNESKRAKDNAEDSSTSQTCDSSGNTQCHKAKAWTLPIRGLKAADLIVTKDQQPYTTFTVSATYSGYTVLTFTEDMTYYGFDVGASDETKGSTDLGVEIKSSSTATGLVNKPEYDYSKLGDTWSAPRIIRLPTQGTLF
jgi:type IV pilus assembly protein PilY1